MTNTPNDPTRPGERNVHGTSTVQAVPGKKDRPWWLWLLPLLLLLGLLFFVLRACDSDDDRVTTTTTEQTTTAEVETVPPATTTAPATPAVGVEQVTLPGGRTLNLQPQTLNYELQRFLGSSEPAPRRFTFDRLNFATGSAVLPTDARETVTALGQILTAYPNARVRIEGYTDARGSSASNTELGAQRANAVVKALIANGIPAARVTAATGGETNPVGANATAQGQAENRRTDLLVTAR